jgi:hypothetical protein
MEGRGDSVARTSCKSVGFTLGIKNAEYRAFRAFLASKRRAASVLLVIFFGSSVPRWLFVASKKGKNIARDGF